jgi:glucose uptake protein
MFIVNSYATAVLFCVVTMLCWGYWANTQKLAAKQWRFELFYWDYVLGIVLTALVFGLTLGSGGAGRGCLADLRQADMASVGQAALGGIIFKAANILLVAAIWGIAIWKEFRNAPKGTPLILNGCWPATSRA